MHKATIKIRGKGTVSLGAVSSKLFRPPRSDTYDTTRKRKILGVAMPDAGYFLDHWEVDRVNMGSQNPIVISLNRTDHEIVAVFSLISASSRTSGCKGVVAHNTLFNSKKQKGKIIKEEDCNILALPSISQLPCRKERIK